MNYDDPTARAAYVAGALEAIEASILELDPPKARELEQWVIDLNLWPGGPPPPAPHWWA